MNFTVEEFSEEDGTPMPPDVMRNVLRLMAELQVLRDELNTPIVINSGYRSPEHNQSVGGSKNSQHLLGKAADIVAQDVSPDETADTIERLINEGKMQQGGLGRYNTFTHYDIRGNKARWDFRK